MNGLPIIAAAALLAGTAARASDPQLGLVVQNNVAVQTIDLTPSYAGTPAPGADGIMAMESMRRYRTDKVKQPPTLRGSSQLGQQVSTAQGNGQMQ